MLKRKFEWFVKQIGGKLADGPFAHGAWVIEQDKYYGWVVCQIAENSTGVHCPFGYNRRTTREMYWTLHFALELLEFQKKTS